MKDGATRCERRRCDPTRRACGSSSDRLGVTKARSYGVQCNLLELGHGERHLGTTRAPRRASLLTCRLAELTAVDPCLSGTQQRAPTLHICAARCVPRSRPSPQPRNGDGLGTTTSRRERSPNTYPRTMGTGAKRSSRRSARTAGPNRARRDGDAYVDDHRRERCADPESVARVLRVHRRHLDDHGPQAPRNGRPDGVVAARVPRPPDVLPGAHDGGQAAREAAPGHVRGRARRRHRAPAPGRARELPHGRGRPDGG